MDARLVGRHADDAEERTERHFPPRLGAADARVRVERPEERDGFCVRDAEPVVERRAEASCLGDAARTDPHLVDPDLERLARARTANCDRADERMTGVELALAFRVRLVLGVAPSGVETREGDRVARLDRQDRLELAREVPVERAALERDLVVRHYAASTRRAASTTRSTDGMYASSICQYGYGTS